MRARGANIQHAATKITNIDDWILRLRLFSHPGKFLFRFQLFCAIIWIVVKRADEKDFFFEMRGRKNERLD